MRGVESERLLDIALPVAFQRLRESKDQIEGEGAKASGGRQLRSGCNRMSVVRAVHPLEYAIVKGLRAQCESRVMPALRQARTDWADTSSGISFKGDFSVWS